jgi:hypothetical protein
LDLLTGEVMKIRQGFVTNSSSTSFIISLKGEFTEENFSNSLGLDKVPWLNRMLDGLYDLVDSKKEDIFDLMKEENEDLDSFLSSFDRKTGRQIKKLLAENRTVYIGTLEDEGCGAEELESFFCRHSFFAENDDIYFNGLDER